MSETNGFNIETSSAEEYFLLAQSLRLPKSGEPKYEDAIKLYTKAAASDTTRGEIYSRSYYCIALCYEKLGDAQKAFAFCRKAVNSKKSVPEADNLLGNYYYSGNGCNEKNYTLAKEYYETAASKGHISAVFNLGLYYSNNEVHDADQSLSFTYFKKAAEAGHLRGTYRLGLCYSSGKGTDEDKEKACECMLSICEKHSHASLWLGGYYRDAGDYNKAIAFFEKALNDKTTSHKAQECINQIKQHYVPEAVKYYILKQDASVFPNVSELEGAYGSLDPLFLYDLALAFEEGGNNVAAIKAYTLSAVKGCRKAKYTLANMAVNNSEYFVKIKNFN